MQKLIIIALVLWGLNATNVKSQTIIASGTSGVLTWQVTSDSLLTISGTGQMSNYTWNSKPWYAHREVITRAVVEEGVTSIGHGAFSRLNKLVSVAMPTTATLIGDGVFSLCSSLQSITIPINIATMGNYLFTNCTVLGKINVESISPPVVAAFTFDGVSGNIPIYVPCGSLTTYQTDAIWGTFSNLQEVEGCTSENDTIYIHDTIYVNVYDTIYIHDTTYITQYDTIYVDTCNNSSLNGIMFEENEIVIFPNPVEKMLNIELKTDFQGKLLLYDVNGKAILTKEINIKQNVIDMRYLTNGVYLLRIITNEGDLVGAKKVIKQ
ncbi:MAG: leucine-rich repeat protein [Bacteroidales bacterium]|jgi:hypothetical protein|nr:leucine-rich repeat protein [Bacteroidales bacterium]